MQIDGESYDSPLEALLLLTRSLLSFEQKHGLASEDFVARYRSGAMGDDRDFVEWAGDYDHYVSLKRELESRLQVAGHG